MSVRDQIKAYIESQPEPKRSDLHSLHKLMLQRFPKCPLRFLDGLNSDGKVIANPNIGYGSYQAQLAKGKTKEFYQVGLSANTTGVSVYIMGNKDKTFLAQTYGKRLGKASVTGYCIKFKALKDIDLGVLEEAIGFGMSKQD